MSNGAKIIFILTLAIGAVLGVTHWRTFQERLNALCWTLAYPFVQAQHAVVYKIQDLQAWRAHIDDLNAHIASLEA